MRRLVREAMEDGAFGIASALIYPPDNFVSNERPDRTGEGHGSLWRRLHLPHPLRGRSLARGASTRRSRSAEAEVCRWRSTT